MQTITTLKDSAYKTIGQWLSSVINNAKSDHDQAEMGASISLFIVERGQARALVGERNRTNRIMFVYPDGPMLTVSHASPEDLCRLAKDRLKNEEAPISCVIATLMDTTWSQESGFANKRGEMTVSIHFNFGYRSLAFVGLVRDSDPTDDSIWMIHTDTPSDSEYDGWARWLTPIEVVNER
jgi:hypothetical protein